MPVMLMLICESGCSFLKLTTESFQGISSDPYKFLGIGGWPMTSVENHWFCAQMKLQGTSLILRHDSHHVTMAYKEKHTPSYFGGQIVLCTKLPAYSHFGQNTQLYSCFKERLSKTKSQPPVWKKKDTVGAPKRKMDFHGETWKIPKETFPKMVLQTVHLPMLQRRSQPGANPSSWIHLEKNARKKFTPKMVGY